jgi:fructokinase
MDLTNRVRELIDDWAKPLRQLENERHRVHGDFRKQNVLVRFDGVRWNVAAILDWECAFLGSPLIDVGLFLRYENSDNLIAEPAFSEGFRDGGGKLPDDWFTLSRVLDLESLCRSLASPNLPLDIEHELAGLVSRTMMELESTCA